jgi:hypothetical protein
MLPKHLIVLACKDTYTKTEGMLVLAHGTGIGGVYLWEAGQDVPPSDGRSLIRAMGEEVLFGAFSPEL